GGQTVVTPLLARDHEQVVFCEHSSGTVDFGQLLINGIRSRLLSRRLLSKTRSCPLHTFTDCALITHHGWFTLSSNVGSKSRGVLMGLHCKVSRFSYTSGPHPCVG